MGNKQDYLIIPNHIGIIMDGNRRWARQKHLPINQGHSQGVKTLKIIIRECIKLGVKYLTVFTLSTENRDREKSETQNLLALINLNLKAIEEFKRDNVKVRVIGNRSNVSESLLRTIEKVESETAKCTGLTLSLAFNYGGQDEIISAVSNIFADKSIENVSVELFEKYLFSGFLPEPELVIRTGGEKRTSGFLLWKAAYSELAFCDKYWPDFSTDDLIDMIEEYNHRERNRGQ